MLVNNSMTRFSPIVSAIFILSLTLMWIYVKKKKLKNIMIEAGKVLLQNICSFRQTNI